MGMSRSPGAPENERHQVAAIAKKSPSLAETALSIVGENNIAMGAHWAGVACDATMNSSTSFLSRLSGIMRRWMLLN